MVTIGDFHHRELDVLFMQKNLITYKKKKFGNVELSTT